jgi:hypothetical protein
VKRNEADGDDAFVIKKKILTAYKIPSEISGSYSHVMKKKCFVIMIMPKTTLLFSK